MPKPAEKGNGPRRSKQRSQDWFRQKAKTIDALLKSIEEKLKHPDFKVSIGDFIRLLQLRKEMEQELPREITVTWVEPSETGDAGAK